LGVATGAGLYAHWFCDTTAAAAPLAMTPSALPQATKSAIARVSELVAMFDDSVKSCVAPQCEPSTPLPGPGVPLRVALMAPPGAGGALVHMLLNATLGDAARSTVHLVSTSRVPPYSGGAGGERTHGYDRIVRLLRKPVENALALAAEEHAHPAAAAAPAGKAKKKKKRVRGGAVELPTAALHARQIIRWHCRLNNAADAHTPVFTLDVDRMLMEPEPVVAAVARFVTAERVVVSGDAVKAAVDHVLVRGGGAALLPPAQVFASLTPDGIAQVVVALDDEIVGTERLTKFPCRTLREPGIPLGAGELEPDCAAADTHCPSKYDLHAHEYGPAATDHHGEEELEPEWE
jgi:hypothetical protein